MVGNSENTRDIRLKTKEILIEQIKKSLDRCDIFQAAKTYSDLFYEIGYDVQRKIITDTEAHDFKVDARRLFSSAENKCKCNKIDRNL